MYCSFRRAALAVAIIGAATGCTRTAVQQNKTPPDPLLISKKPVEGKPTSNPTGREFAHAYPQPPSFTTEGTAVVEGGVPARLSSELVVRPDR